MRKQFLTALLAVLMLFATVAAFAVNESPLERFEITPNPMERDCTISLSFTNPQVISLQILDNNRELIYKVYSGYAGKHMNFSWDRTDLTGQLVPNGSYIVVLSYDARYTSTKKTLILK